MNAPPTVHLVDDDASVRNSVARLLRLKGYETACHGSAGEFLTVLAADEPGCIVLDVRMPGASGLDLQEALATRAITMPVIFLTGHGSIPMSVRAMKAGAVDFLTKPVSARALLGAVEAALARDREHRLQRAQRRLLETRFQGLTGREREVFSQVTAGRLNKQIATDLGISERTVKAHRAQVMQKMDVRSLAELVRIAAQFREPATR
jgi:FixJ family two-component response regulator